MKYMKKASEKGISLIVLIITIVVIVILTTIVMITVIKLKDLVKYIVIAILIIILITIGIKLFPKKEEQYKSVKLEDIDYDAIINKINKKLTCNDDFCIMDDDKYEIVYMFSNNLLMISTYDGNISFVYDSFKKSYTYTKYSNNNIVKNYDYNIEENKLECKIGNCNNYEEEVKDYLKIVYSILE